jgi:hypothetical protein
MYLRRRDRHIFLSSQASQPHYFKIHLGVIFLSCPINMGMTLSQTVSTADLKLPFVRKQIYISRSGFRKANYIRKRIREANYIRKRIGSGLEADWKRIGSGLEADWKRIGSGLRANSVGDNDMRHTTYDASLRNGHFFFGCLAREKNTFKKAPHILHQHRQHYPRQSTKQHLSPASASWKV